MEWSGATGCSTALDDLAESPTCTNPVPTHPHSKSPNSRPPFTTSPHHHQGFLAEGLQRTGAGLGSVIIDSQPLTVALLAALLFGERLSALGVLGEWGLSVCGL